jgi:hypothetical protein
MPQAPGGKQRSRGCLTVLAVTGALFLVACLSSGLVAWRAFQSPEGRAALDGARRFGRLAEKGSELLTQESPGTKELEAAGCSTAVVLDLNALASAVKEAFDGGEPEGDEGDEPEGPPSDDEDDAGFDPFAGALVTCEVSDGGALPACDELARVYAQAAKPTNPFTVSASGSDAGCTAQYDVAGARRSP